MHLQCATLNEEANIKSKYMNVIKTHSQYSQYSKLSIKSNIII